MTKADLIEEISRVLEVTRNNAQVILECILDSMVRSIRRGEKVEVRRFGCFGIRHRGPRTGRNPKSGTSVEVPPKRVPYFKVSKELKKLVNPSA